MVGLVEPVREMGCGFVGRFPIERHHGTWDAGDSDEVRSPALVGHPGDFDHKGPAGDCSFKAVLHEIF